MRIFTQGAPLSRKVFEGIVGLICLGFIGLVLAMILTTGRHHPLRIACISNLKRLGMASLLYAEDWDGRLPQRDTWMDAIRDYHKSGAPERCNEVEFAFPDRKDVYGYAFNSRLSGGKTSDFEPETQQTKPMLYDSSNLARNASDPFSSLPDPPRHGGEMNMVCFFDGHVKGTKPSAAKLLKP